MDTSTSNAIETALRIVFAGTPDFSATQLRALVDGPHQLIAVYSQPDRRSGRGKKLLPSPVKTAALQQGIPVFQPRTLREPDAQSQLAALKPDVMIVVAYGLLLPQTVLDIPRYGCINIHASLLPRWRGAAPVERAIEAGDRETGITIMQMDAGLDTGAILHQSNCVIDESATGDSLRQQLSELGPAALRHTLDQLARGCLLPVDQDDALSSYADKLGRDEAWLDWTQAADTLARKIRAFRSANVTCSQLGEERIRIWMAEPADEQAPQPPGTIVDSGKHVICVACGSGVLRIRELQLPGRKVLPAAAVLNSRKALFEPGQRFSMTSGDHHGA